MWALMGPCGPIWVARGEKNNVGNVKIIISSSDFFLGLCHGDTIKRTIHNCMQL